MFLFFHCYFVVTALSSLAEIRKESFSRIQHYELLYFNLDHFASDNQIEFDLFNQHYKIQLFANPNMIPSQINPISGHPRTPTESKWFSNRSESCHYHGHIIEPRTQTDHTVALSLCPNRGIRGSIIMDHDTKIWIKPAAYYLDEENKRSKYYQLSDQHLVYKSSDYDRSGIPIREGGYSERRSGINDEYDNVGVRTPLTSSRKLLASKACELYVLVDVEQVQDFKDDHGGDWYEQLLSTAMDSISSVDNDYRNLGDVGDIDVKLVRFEVVESWSGDYRGLKPDDWSRSEIDGDDYRKQFRSWLSDTDRNKYDAHQIWTTKKWDYAMGWASVGCVCESSKCTGSVLNRWSDEENTNTVAHELGHNLGAKHDDDEGCDRDDGIMGNEMHGWSRCSIEAFEEHYDDSGGLRCLENSPKSFSSNVNSDNNNNDDDNYNDNNNNNDNNNDHNNNNNDPNPDCVSVQNAEGYRGGNINGNYIANGQNEGKKSYKQQSGNYWLYWVDDEWQGNWWTIDKAKPDTSWDDGWCGSESHVYNILQCNGRWETDTGINEGITFSQCSGDTSRNRYYAYGKHDEVGQNDNDEGNNNDDGGNNNINNADDLGECYKHGCVTINHLKTAYKDFNGYWYAQGCFNGHEYYELDKCFDRRCDADKVLCYNTIFQRYIISDTLCSAANADIHAKCKVQSVDVTACQNNWAIKKKATSEQGQYAQDTDVETIASCKGSSAFSFKPHSVSGDCIRIIKLKSKFNAEWMEVYTVNNKSVFQNQENNEYYLYYIKDGETMDYLWTIGSAVVPVADSEYSWENGWCDKSNIKDCAEWTSAIGRDTNVEFIDCDDEIEEPACLKDNKYSSSLCVVHMNMSISEISNGNIEFQVSTEECMNNKPVYQYIKNETIYYLYYNLDLIRPQWIVSKDIMSTNGMAYCDESDLLKCMDGEWKIHRRVNSDSDQLVNDQNMTILNRQCVTNGYDEMNVYFMIEIALIISIAIGIVIGCIVYRSKRNNKLGTLAKGVEIELSDSDGFEEDEESKSGIEIQVETELSTNRTDN